MCTNCSGMWTRWTIGWLTDWLIDWLACRMISTGYSNSTPPKLVSGVTWQVTLLRLVHPTAHSYYNTEYHQVAANDLMTLGTISSVIHFRCQTCKTFKLVHWENFIIFPLNILGHTAQMVASNTDLRLHTRRRLEPLPFLCVLTLKGRKEEARVGSMSWNWPWWRCWRCFVA